jgi:hypothetical protein
LLVPSSDDSTAPQAGSGAGLNLTSLTAQLGLGKDQGDKESVISDSYGESYNEHSPDAQDYYGRFGHTLLVLLLLLFFLLLLLPLLLALLLHLLLLLRWDSRSPSPQYEDYPANRRRKRGMQGHGGKRHNGSYNEYVNYDWESPPDRRSREGFVRSRPPRLTRAASSRDSGWGLALSSLLPLVPL